jgi:hypothetical protein
MSVIGIFRHLRQHPSGGGSYNFLLADKPEVDGSWLHSCHTTRGDPDLVPSL